MDEDQAPSEVRVGEYAIPARLNRLNPGAFLLAGLWALVYGIWPWFFSMLGLTVLTLVLALRLHNVVHATPWGPVTWQVGFLVATRAVAAAFALRANRLFWGKEHRRIHAQVVPRPPDLVSKFDRDQRKWLIGGLAFLGYELLISPVVLGGRTWQAFVSPAIAVGFDLLALALLILWDRRTRPAFGQS